MKIKRKELPCVLGKVTVEEFHDGYRMHIAVIAEHSAPPSTFSDEYEHAYRDAGIVIKADRREVRFSVPDHIVMQLVQAGELSAETGVIEALQVLARAAWAVRDDPSPVWAYEQTYVWGPSASAAANSAPFGYGFHFPHGSSSEGLDY